MHVDQILKSIDQEIKRLEEARALLAANVGKNAIEDKRPVKPKRRMSAEARKRIADAQRKRWAALKKGTK